MGWQAELAAWGVPADEALIATTEGWGHEDGSAGMARLLDSGALPDAVLAYNDLIAIGAMRVLGERGLRVPEDVAVVGFDDITESRYGAVSLTTVAPDKQAIARLAVESVTEQLKGAQGDGPPLPPREVQPGFQLVVRESTVQRAAAAGST